MVFRKRKWFDRIKNEKQRNSFSVKGTSYPSNIVNSKDYYLYTNKPMIYYSLSLMLAGVKDILIISSNEYLPIYKKLFGDGSKLGILMVMRLKKKRTE